MIQLPGLMRYGSGRRIPAVRIIALAVMALIILVLLLREPPLENEVQAVPMVHLSSTTNLAKVFHLKPEGSNEVSGDRAKEEDRKKANMVPAQTKEEQKTADVVPAQTKGDQRTAEVMPAQAKEEEHKAVGVVPAQAKEEEHKAADVVPVQTKEEVTVPKGDISGEDFKGPAGSKGTNGSTIVMPDPQWEGWDAIENLFVFGDSTTDTGFWLHNEAKLPNPQNPFGNHARDPYRVFAPKWPHFLAGNYNQSSILVWNLAWGGSTTDKDVVDAWALASSLKEEVGKFSNATREGTTLPKWKAKSSLFTVAIGINDINLTSGDRESNKTAPIDDSLKSYRASLDKLYELGARNFLLLNAPALYLAMADAPPELKRDISEFNHRLEVMRANFSRDHNEHVTIFLFDWQQFIEDIVAQPTMLPHTKNITYVETYMGFCNACIFTDVYNEEDLECNSDPTFPQHMFCDLFHPSYILYNATAATIATDCFQQTRTRRHPRGYCS